MPESEDLHNKNMIIMADFIDLFVLGMSKTYIVDLARRLENFDELENTS